MVHISLSVFKELLIFTDYGARSIFTYSTLDGEYNRMRIKIPQNISKIIWPVKNQDDIVLILEDKVLRTNGTDETQEMPKNGKIGNLNLNCSCISANDSVYFLSDFKPMVYSLSDGKIEQA